MHATEDLRADREVALAMVAEDGVAPEHASENSRIERSLPGARRPAPRRPMVPARD